MKFPTHLFALCVFAIATAPVYADEDYMQAFRSRLSPEQLQSFDENFASITPEEQEAIKEQIRNQITFELVEGEDTLTLMCTLPQHIKCAQEDCRMDCKNDSSTTVIDFGGNALVVVAHPNSIGLGIAADTTQADESAVEESGTLAIAIDPASAHLTFEGNTVYLTFNRA